MIQYNKIFELIKNLMSFTRLASLLTLTSVDMLSAAPLNAIPMSCISMTNQKCKVRPQIVNANRDDSLFYPFSNKTSKCGGSCNNINDPYAQMCVPDVAKN